MNMAKLEQQIGARQIQERRAGKIGQQVGIEPTRAEVIRRQQSRRQAQQESKFKSAELEKSYATVSGATNIAQYEALLNKVPDWQKPYIKKTIATLKSKQQQEINRVQKEITQTDKVRQSYEDKWLYNKRVKHDYDSADYYKKQMEVKEREIRALEGGLGKIKQGQFISAGAVSSYASSVSSAYESRREARQQEYTQVKALGFKTVAGYRSAVKEAKLVSAGGVTLAEAKGLSVGAKTLLSISQADIKKAERQESQKFYTYIDPKTGYGYSSAFRPMTSQERMLGAVDVGKSFVGQDVIFSKAPKDLSISFDLSKNGISRTTWDSFGSDNVLRSASTSSDIIVSDYSKVEPIQSTSEKLVYSLFGGEKRAEDYGKGMIKFSTMMYESSPGKMSDTIISERAAAKGDPRLKEELERIRNIGSLEQAGLFVAQTGGIAATWYLGPTTLMGATTLGMTSVMPSAMDWGEESTLSRGDQKVLNEMIEERNIYHQTHEEKWKDIRRGKEFIGTEQEYKQFEKEVVHIEELNKKIESKNKELRQRKVTKKELAVEAGIAFGTTVLLGGGIKISWVGGKK